jgi:signal transduction histidine kinase
MKRIKYSTLRRITFTVYLLTTVVFCLYLIKLGDNEVSKAKAYTEKEKQNVITLLSCREKMDAVEHSFNQLQLTTSSSTINKFLLEVTKLRTSIDMLTTLEARRTSRDFMPDSQLKNQGILLNSLANALKEELKNRSSDGAILLKEDLNALSDTMTSLRSELQERLNVELNHVENWQNQSLFFFERLEVLLVSFFILATIFSLSAFAISGAVLKSYLGRISKGANEISSGNFAYRFNDTTSDVVGQVMCDFDIMAIQLQKQTLLMGKINKELKEKADELLELNMHKDRFLANMSHELRTPLNAIIGFSDLLIAKSQSITPQKTEEFASKILSAAEHLLELISDLLEIAKFDAGVLTHEYTEFDIKKVMKNVIEMLQPIAEKKELQLTLKVQQKESGDKKEDELKVTADRRLIRQVLINIINNALKYTKEGEVIVTLEENQNISGTSDIRIEVKDTGIGISQKDSLLIFKDFHRVEQGLTSNFEGVGLGLTLSKRIIELHKGEITVQSELKKGSTFTILLPKEQE